MKRAPVLACVALLVAILAMAQSKVRATQENDDASYAGELRVGDWIVFDKEEGNTKRIEVVPRSPGRSLIEYRKEQQDDFDAFRAAKNQRYEIDLEIAGQGKSGIVGRDKDGRAVRIINGRIHVAEEANETDADARASVAQLDALHRLVDQIEAKVKVKYPQGERELWEVAAVGRDFFRFTNAESTMSIPHAFVCQIKRPAGPVRDGSQ